MNEKLNKNEGIPATRLNLQTKGANGLSQTLNSPTPNGEESVTDANQNFLSHTFPQAQILQPKQDGKKSANADIENPSYNRGGYSQFLQALGKEGETKTMANQVRPGADNATIEIYPYTRKDLKNPEIAIPILKDLYWNQGLSLTQIAKIFGKCRHNLAKLMQKYGIQMRTPMEASAKASTKYPRKPFTGSPAEKAYMIGLRYGDISARKRHQYIYASTATTHPAMLKLFEETFNKYGHVARYPVHRIDKQTGKEYYNWVTYCHLDQTFNFLLEKTSTLPNWIVENDQQFLAFLAGFTDSEGSILISKFSHGVAIKIRVVLYNQDEELLRNIKMRLEALGVHPRLYRGQAEMMLTVIRKCETIRLLQMLPLRHAEKIEKREIAIRAFEVNRWRCIEPEFQAYRKWVHDEVDRLSLSAQSRQHQ